MNDDEHENFMKKKIRRTGKENKSGSSISEQKTIIATILVTIVIMSGVLVYTIWNNPIEPEQFSAMYVLDSEKQANNYPQTVILGTNSTFTLWLGVENQKDQTVDYSVQTKLDDGSTTEEPSQAEPIQVFNRTLVNGEKWEFPVTINIDQPGNNRLIFELQFYNVELDMWEYTWIRLDFTIEAIQAG